MNTYATDHHQQMQSITVVNVPLEARSPQALMDVGHQCSYSCIFCQEPFQTCHTHHTKHSAGPQPDSETTKQINL